MNIVAVFVQDSTVAKYDAIVLVIYDVMKEQSLFQTVVIVDFIVKTPIIFRSFANATYQPLQA